MKLFLNCKKLFILLPLFAGLFLAASAQAYTLEVSLPGITAEATTDPGAYVRYLFIFGLSLAGFLAVGAIAWGGIQYMAAGTSLTSVQKAKELIVGAISGIVLLLCSWLILNTIGGSGLTNLTPWVPPLGNVAAPPAPAPESNATRNCNPPCRAGFFCRTPDYTCQAIPTAASSHNIACLTPGQCLENACTATGSCNNNRPARLPRLIWNPNTCVCALP